MYNISELSSMSDEQLKGVAEAMGLTKIDLANRESAVYEILDQQALNSVATAKNRKQPSDKPKGNRLLKLLKKSLSPLAKSPLTCL